MKLKRNNRRHKKYVLLGIISLLVIAAAGTTFALAKSQSGTKSPSAAADLSQRDSSDFVMVATTGLSYRATVLTTYNGERPDRTTVMDRDGKNGASRFTSKVNDEVTAKVFSGEVTYSCDRQACEKLIWRDDAPYADNTEQLAYDFLPGTIERLKQQAMHKGEAACPAGTCFVWSVVPDDTMLSPYSETLYIDKRTKSISKDVRKYTTTDYTTTVTYDYQPRTITVPPVPQEIPEL